MTIKRLFITFFFLMIITFISSNKGHADDSSGFKLLKEWDFQAGVYMLYKPKYEGSKEMKIYIYPLAAAIYKEFLVITYTDISCWLPVPKAEKYLVAGLTLTYDFFKIDNNNFNDYEKGVVLIPMLIFTPNEYFKSSVTIEKAFGGSDSLTTEIRAGVRYDIKKRLELSLSGLAIYADKKHMQFKFGVSDEGIAQIRL